MKRYTYNGKTLTIWKWATEPENIHGIKFKTLINRVTEMGMTIAEALNTPRRKRLLLTHNGKTLTAHGWSKEPENIHKLSAGCLVGRIRSGESIKKALSRPALAPLCYTCQGQSLPLTEWVKSPLNAEGYSYSDLYDRVVRRCDPLWKVFGLPEEFGEFDWDYPIQDTPAEYVVFKIVTANGRGHRTYWIGGCFSRLGEPLRMSQLHAKWIARRHGGQVEHHQQAQAA